jgi:nucleotide-binding universal stress UspA family protein
MIKDILVSLSLDESHDASGDYAMSVAELFGAHLSGIALAYIPVIPVTTPMEALGADLIVAEHAKNMKAAAAAVARFDRSMRAGGLRGEARLLDAGIAEASKEFGEFARRFDLSVVGQAKPSDPEDGMIVEGALFGSGRPVIVVPYIQRKGIKLDRVVVCWDGSRAAARATGDAMPFLTRAKKVDVVTIGAAPAKSEEVPGADIAQHLARHGRNVEVQRLVVADIDTTSAILSYVADAGADLIVMGGYGHSRLREFVLGGVTRGILGSMTVPVLMSH